ncbi:tetraacyldisaccharide 4'-kinase [Halomonas cibimaris]|uniref:Tetraacyldisaccharide 4'-kinase n=1 Tax=Halomonas cibimaris TaxID=657012 RepID=A0ABP7LTP5_9GAMM
MSLAERWVNAAYRGSRWLSLLRPLAALYRLALARRRRAYVAGKKAAWRAPVPVIVAGNITLGGTGKSPLVAWLVRWLGQRGYSPGVITRGYGGRADYPLWVTPDTPPAQSGDEPLMLAQQTGAAVVADPCRARGVRALVDAGCDIVVSDDGLQHLALARDIELAVVDGARGLGNGQCLPAGPLREPPERLQSVDAVLVNGPLAAPLSVAAQPMHLAPTRWRRLADGQTFALSPLPFALPVRGVAGIGRPARFFATLEALGVHGRWQGYADHHRFTAEELKADNGQALVMTAKDAVKCRELAPPDSWVLDVEAVLPADFERWLAARLSALTCRRQAYG